MPPGRDLGRVRLEAGTGHTACWPPAHECGGKVGVCSWHPPGHSLLQRLGGGGGLTPAGAGVSTQTLDSPDSRPLVPTEPDLPPALLH